MGESGDAGDESDDSASDAESSAFEFEEGLADEDTDISDVVDFSGGDEEGSAGSTDGDSDASDPPDEPDPDSDDDAEEPVETEGSGSGTRSVDDTAASPSSSEAATSAGSGAERSEDRAASESGEEPDGDEDEPDPDDPDSDDPPDAQDDSGDGGLYDIDPVDKSQQAFDFAETQSKAAYEFAYEGATKNPLARFILKYTSPEVRERVDEVFSRRMLGSVLVGGAFSKIVEAFIGVYFGTASLWRPVAWGGVFVLATLAFVWWEHLARKASEAAESASEAASEAAESASKKASEAAESASIAAEAASDAAGDSTDAEDGNGPQAGRSEGANTLNEAGQMLGTQAGGGPPSERTRRRRAPNRRPNKRFHGDSTDGEDRRRSDGTPFETVDRAELTDGSLGFKDPGDADEL